MSNRLSEDTRVLAAYCTYKILFDEDKDVYDVVAEFIKSAIYNDNKYKYTQIELSDLIKREFGIRFPQFVIRTASKRLKKFITLNDNQYEIDRNELQLNLNPTFIDIQKLAVKKAESVLDEFDRFVKENNSDYFNQFNLQTINQYFLDYLLDKNIDNDKVEAIISAFIVKNEKNQEFIETLDTMRSGRILYVGLQNNEHAPEFGAWNTELTIYLDMEILFFIAGYNGIAYQRILEEFLDLVKTANQKKKYIQLRFFKETKKEISEYFFDALLFQKKHIPIRPSTAMDEILKNCVTKSDVRNKETELFRFLRTKGIIEDSDRNYYSDDLKRYNLESKELVEKYSSTDDEKEKNEIRLRLVSHINKLRRGEYVTDYRKCKYILMTGTIKTLQMALDFALEAKSNHESYNNDTRYIPCAVHTSDLTNVIWFKLNGALGSAAMYPSTIKSLLKAQMVLSGLTSKKVSEQYDVTQKEFSDGKITQVQCIDRIVGLREQEKRPENINIKNIDDVCEFLTEDKINSYVEEKYLLRSENERKDKEIKQLKEDLKKQEQYQQQVIHEKDINQKELNSWRIKDSINRLKDQKNLLEKKKNEILSFININRKVTCISIIFVIIIVPIILIVIWEKISWEMFDRYSTIGSMICQLFLTALSFYNRKNIEKWEIILIISNYVFRFLYKHKFNKDSDVNEIDAKLLEFNQSIKKLEQQLQENTL